TNLTTTDNGTGTITFDLDSVLTGVNSITSADATNLVLTGGTSGIVSIADTFSVTGPSTFTNTITAQNHFTLDNLSEFRFADAGINYTGFKAPATVGTSVVYTLPTGDGGA